MKKSICICSFLLLLAFIVGCRNMYKAEIYSSGNYRNAPAFLVIDIGLIDTFLVETYAYPNSNKKLMSLVTIEKDDSLVLYRNLISPNIQVSKVERHKSSDSLFKTTVFNKYGRDMTDEFIYFSWVFNDSIFLRMNNSDLRQDIYGINEIQTFGLTMGYKRLPHYIYYDSLNTYSKSDSIVIHLNHTLPLGHISINSAPFINLSDSEMILYNFCDIILYKDSSVLANDEQFFLKFNTLGNDQLVYSFDQEFEIKGRSGRRMRRFVKDFYKTLEGYGVCL